MLTAGPETFRVNTWQSDRQKVTAILLRREGN